MSLRRPKILFSLISTASGKNARPFPIGGGTNMLVKDGGIEGASYPSGNSGGSAVAQK